MQKTIVYFVLPLSMKITFVTGTGMMGTDPMFLELRECDRSINIQLLVLISYVDIESNLRPSKTNANPKNPHFWPCWSNLQGIKESKLKLHYCTFTIFLNLKI